MSIISILLKKKSTPFNYAYQLYVDYKNRIRADSGTVNNITLTKDAYRKLPKVDNILFGWMAGAGSKKRTSTIYSFFTKLYTMVNPTPVYGAELIVNGGFDSDTVWTKGIGVTISNGVCNFNTVTNSNINQLISITAGRVYKIILRVSDYTRGAPFVAIGQGNNVLLNNFNGVNTLYVISGLTDSIVRIYSGTAGIGGSLSIDDLSIQEVINGVYTVTDATQTTEASQPRVTGNIAPGDVEALQNQNGEARFMTHPAISFAANEAWSWTGVINSYSKQAWMWLFGNNVSNALSAFYLQQGVNNYPALYNQSGSIILFSSTTLNDLIGKATNITITYDSSNYRLYKNGILSTTAASVDGSFIFKKLMSYEATRYLHGNYLVHIIRNIALTPAEVLTEATFLRTKYPEIPQVTIGSQTWALRNCDMVATPQGNVIANVTENANVEKVTVAADREFSSDTGFWSKTGTSTISAGVANIIGNNNEGLSKTSTLIASKWYKFTYTIVTVNSGSLSVYAGDTQGILRNSTGTFIEYIQCSSTGSTNLRIYGKQIGTNIVIDNVSVQEVGWAGSQELYDGIYAQTAESASAVEKITATANRDFSSDTGWWTKGSTWVIGDNVATVTNPAAISYLQKLALIVSGKWYKCQMTINSISGGNLYFRVGNNNLSEYYNTPGVKIAYVFSDGVDFNVRANAGVTAEIDNISVKELGVTGNEESYTYAAVKAAAMWCFYNNSADNGAIYGKLYNWFAVKLLQMDIDYYNAANPATPWGWRVPTSTDFTNLATALGGASVAGGKMKMTGLNYWQTPNTGADNSSGFTALGGGYRVQTSGVFSGLGNTVQYNVIDIINNVYYLLNTNSELGLSIVSNTQRGCSLRLIKT